jgi:hypothetical protein
VGSDCCSLLDCEIGKCCIPEGSEISCIFGSQCCSGLCLNHVCQAAVCDVPPTVKSYTDLTLDPASATIGVFTYNLSEKDYKKTLLPSALIFVVNLTDKENINLCYTQTDAGGNLDFPYNPEAIGCTDLWFIFCPLAEASKGTPDGLASRELCLNSTRLDYNGLIKPAPQACLITMGPPPPIKSYPDHILSHNLLYFCNKVPRDYAPLCWPLMLILGLLLAANFAVGRNPFHTFDMSSPRMQRGRQYSARVQNRSFDYLSYVMSAASTAMSFAGKGGKTEAQKADIKSAKRGAERKAVRDRIKGENKTARQDARKEKYDTGDHKTGVGKFLHKAGVFLGVHRTTAEQKEIDAFKKADYPSAGTGPNAGGRVNMAHTASDHKGIGKFIHRIVAMKRFKNGVDEGSAVKEKELKDMVDEQSKEKGRAREKLNNAKKDYEAAVQRLADAKEKGDAGGIKSAELELAKAKAIYGVAQKIFKESKADFREARSEGFMERYSTSGAGAGGGSGFSGARVASSPQTTMWGSRNVIGMIVSCFNGELWRASGQSAAAVGNSLYAIADRMYGKRNLKLGQGLMVLMMFLLQKMLENARMGTIAKKEGEDAIKKDKDGNPIVKKDKHGHVIYEKDSSGNPVFYINEEGQSVQKPEYVMKQKIQLSIFNMKNPELNAWGRTEEFISSVFRLYAVAAALSSYTEGAASMKKGASGGIPLMEAVNGVELGHAGKYTLNVSELASYFDPFLSQNMVGGGLPAPLQQLSPFISMGARGADYLAAKAFGPKKGEGNADAVTAVSDTGKKYVLVGDDVYVSVGGKLILVNKENITVNDDNSITITETKLAKGPSGQMEQVEEANVLKPADYKPAAVSYGASGPTLLSSGKTEAIFKDRIMELEKNNALRQANLNMIAQYGGGVKDEQRREIIEISQTEAALLRTGLKALQGGGGLQSDFSLMLGSLETIREQAKFSLQMMNMMDSMPIVAKYLGEFKSEKDAEAAIKKLRETLVRIEDGTATDEEKARYNEIYNSLEAAKMVKVISVNKQLAGSFIEFGSLLDSFDPTVFGTDKHGNSLTLSGQYQELLLGLTAIRHEYIKMYASAGGQLLEWQGGSLMTEAGPIGKAPVDMPPLADVESKLYGDDTKTPTEKTIALQRTLQAFEATNQAIATAGMVSGGGALFKGDQEKLSESTNSVVISMNSMLSNPYDDAARAEFDSKVTSVARMLCDNLDFKGQFGNRAQVLQQAVMLRERYEADASRLSTEEKSIVENMSESYLLEDILALHQTSKSYLSYAMGQSGWMSQSVYMGDPKQKTLVGMPAPEQAKGERKWETSPLYPAGASKDPSREKYRWARFRFKGDYGKLDK